MLRRHAPGSRPRPPRASAARAATPRSPARWLGPLLLAAALCAVLAALHTTAPARAAGPHVDVAQFDVEVDPASLHFVQGVVSRAEQDGASALVLQIDTPGGDIASMQTIVQAELGSTVPILTYVSPSGGSADSAGTFVALAAPIAAMAPDTRIGAASPIDSSGNDLQPTLKAKLTNALVALIRRIQNTFGRNADLAAAAVTNASSYDDQTAVSSDLVNLDASSVEDLLSQVDGRSVTLANGHTVTLAVADQPLENLDPTVVDQVDTILFDPNFLFLLFIVAAVCIYLELSHPGAIVPGTIGGIALLLFLYGAGSLSPNWAGLALMLLAIVLLAVDVRTPTHGVLTLGALISLVIGTLLFFNTGPSDQAVNPWIVLGTAAGVGVIAAVVLRFAIGAQRAKVDTGTDRLIGQIATVVEPLAPTGRVRILGELWSAAIADPTADPRSPRASSNQTDRVEAGAQVRVVAVEGLRLLVRPVT